MFYESILTFSNQWIKFNYKHTEFLILDQWYNSHYTLYLKYVFSIFIYNNIFINSPSVFPLLGSYRHYLIQYYLWSLDIYALTRNKVGQCWRSIKFKVPGNFRQAHVFSEPICWPIPNVCLQPRPLSSMTNITNSKALF